jgi:hypothetical protein
VLDIKKQFGDLYTVRWDEAKKAGGWTEADYPYLRQIAGDSGFISLWKEDALAVVAIGKRKSRELAKLAGIDLNLPRPQQTPKPGWTLLQFGDWELRLGFPTDEIDAAARVIGARQRVPLSAKEKERLTAWGKERKRIAQDVA